MKTTALTILGLLMILGISIAYRVWKYEACMRSQFLSETYCLFS